MSIVIIAIIAVICSAAGCYAGYSITSKIVRNKKAAILKEAESAGEMIKKEKILQAKEKFIQLKSEHDRAVNERNQKLSQSEQRAKQLENNLTQQQDELNKKIREQDSVRERLQAQIESVERKKEDLDRKIKEQNTRLEQISGLSSDEAKNILIENMKEEAKTEAMTYVNEVMEEAKMSANKEAKKIVVQTIQRVATEAAIENSVTVFNIESDEVKGRIIGREGRNIRALEAATGIEIIVDDTPEAIILSGFDPVRREIARLALHQLVTDGRIHPARIEEVVAKVQKQIEEEIVEAGKRTTIDLGIHGLHPELIRLIGKMKYRSSYGQNLLQHSREVANLCGIMASELGLNAKMARRAGLLHDIGKVSIPDEIINKPGKLTKEEFEIMKSHTTVGADLLHDLPFSNEEPLLKTAYEIARWHHERYDGRGYPDGLTGEEIPIAAQVVSVADVYDALTSVRCYKSAYDHETALRMIVNGECGTFNPLLLECLLDASLQIRERLLEANEGYTHSTARTQQLSTEMMLKQATPQVGRSIQALETERIKTDFFAKQSCGIQFDYDAATRTISVTDHTDTLPFGSRLYDATDTEKFTIFSKDDLNRLENALSATTRDAPDVSMPITLRFPEVGWEHEYMLAARALWSSDAKPRYLGAVGQFREPQTDIMLPEMALPDSGAVTGRQLAASMEGMSRIFDVVRLVDPKRGEILQLNADGTFSDRVLPCSPVWNHGKRCSRCISRRCMEDKTRMSKLELTDECAYQLISRYLVVDGRECVLELGSRLSDSVWVTSGGRQFRLDASHGEDFYLDPVTGAYGRRYLEDQQPELEKAEALAVIDIDNFKEINDEYGHLAGDAVLRHVANVILARVNIADTLVRYGGDEFVLLLSHIPPEKFRSILERIRGAVYTTEIPQYENIHPTVSIGGVYQAHPLIEAIRRADKLMYWAKQKRNDVQT